MNFVDEKFGEGDEGPLQMCRSQWTVEELRWSLELGWLQIMSLHCEWTLHWNCHMRWEMLFDYMHHLFEFLCCQSCESGHMAIMNFLFSSSEWSYWVHNHWLSSPSMSRTSETEWSMLPSMLSQTWILLRSQCEMRILKVYANDEYLEWWSNIQVVVACLVSMVKLPSDAKGVESACHAVPHCGQNVTLSKLHESPGFLQNVIQYLPSI